MALCGCWSFEGGAEFISFLINMVCVLEIEKTQLVSNQVQFSLDIVTSTFTGAVIDHKV